MKRLLLLSAALFALFHTVGCCYRPGCVDPCTGMAYGGAWEPRCGGPLDPLGVMCAINYGYGGCNPCPPDPCCDPCATPCVSGYATAGCDVGCADSYPQTYMSQPYMSQPYMMPGQPVEGVPGGGMKPVPEPDMSTPKTKTSANATTYVTPRPLPRHHGQRFHHAGRRPWVSAF